MFPWLKKKTGPPRSGDATKRVIIFKHLLVKGLATAVYAENMKGWNEAERNEFISEVQRRSADQIARLRKSGLWNEMDQHERDFIQAGPTDVTGQGLVNVSWLADSAVCLLWALGYVSAVPPYDQESDPKLTNELPLDSVDVLVKKATLRPADTIMKQRDLAELWHWRSRTRQLQESGRMPTGLHGGKSIDQIIQMAAAKAAGDGAFPAPIGDDFPAFGKPYRELTSEEFSRATSIAMERHRAFNWLCGYAPGNRWADTPTDT